MKPDQKTEKPQKQARETATQAFYREVAELRPQLPKDWKIQFIEMYPQYDSYRGGLILHNVINGASTDPVVLEGIKKIIEKSNTRK